ncbi:MAG: hypothetical protein ABMA64_03685 [Myxococcota bacterium]
MWWAVGAWAGACDPAAVAEVVAAIPQVRGDQQSTLAAAGLSEACDGTALAAAAGRYAHDDPGHRAIADAELVLAEPARFMAGCSGGLQVLADAAQLTAVDRRSAMWARCGFADRGWCTADEWARADGALVLPVVAAAVLAESGVPASDARSVVRALIGIPAGGAGVGGPTLREEVVMDIVLPPREPVPPPPGVPGGVLFDPEPTGAMSGVASLALPPFTREVAPSAGARCVVELTVGPTGWTGEAQWTDCPSAARRKEVLRALRKSTFDTYDPPRVVEVRY